MDIYFSGEEPKFTPPLHPTGSAFRQAVWQILLQIPYGQTITYGEIARQMSQIQNTPHMSAQAVGGAVGHNEISLIIPCHRVVGTNGSLTGYAGGIDKKIALLKLEHTDMGHLFVPKKETALSKEILLRIEYFVNKYKRYSGKHSFLCIKRSRSDHSSYSDYKSGTNGNVRMRNACSGNAESGFHCDVQPCWNRR